MARSLNAALALCGDDDEVFVIGGAQLYRDAMPHATRLYLTEIEADFAGDVYFPEFERAEWMETAREAHLSANGLCFSYVICDRLV